MHRFFVLDTPALQPDSLLDLPQPTAHQVRTVLHLTVGERIILLDNTGDEVICEIRQSERSGVSVLVLERRAGKREAAMRITLCQGLLKSARFEWILEKGTELGVTTFLPVQCRRSIAEGAGAAKIQRWQRIIQEATEQCGGARLPALLPVCPLKQALAAVPEGALALMPWEEEQGQSLHEALRAGLPQGVSDLFLFIGPEGGLAAEEVEQARASGVLTVSLGSRILRAETAALVAVANVLYESE
jgi:16S rRNA (uracil1498-N3)-methyltransferase